MQFTTIDESDPSDPTPVPAAPGEPPPPTTTAPKATPPHTECSIFLKPPAPPPAPPLPPLPPPPPATTTVLIILVPGCVVTALGVLDVLVVIVFLPRDVTFVGPIIPPLAIAYSTSYASSITSYETKSVKSEAALAPPSNTSPSSK